MQSQEEKLRLFLEAINSYAEKQRLTILQDMEQYTSAELDKAEAEALREAYVHISRETAEVRASIVRELSAHELQARRRLFEQRAAIEDEVFAEAEKSLKEYAAGERYDDYLTRAAQTAAAKAEGQRVVVRVRPADEGKSDLLSGLIPGCAVETDPSIVIGGFTAELTLRGAIIDMTLDSRLAAQREVFRRTSGLTIEE